MLALDTSASAGAALLERDVVLAAAASPDRRRHAEVLQPLVEQVLASAGAGRADVTAVAVGVGPGPYTGLRVGMAAALVLGLALDVPVHGVCSLDAAALAAWSTAADGVRGRLGVATDARRREVYWATYATYESCRATSEDGAGPGAAGPRRVAGPDVGSARDVAGEAPAWVGPGTGLYPESLPAADVRADLGVTAAWVGRVAAEALAGRGALRLVPVEPLYLRRPDAVAVADRTPPPLPASVAP
ncbi:tRNA (adenosine(37)-N6)-threonylcarbamoyltransferase complex dimerization subunit type 1 TsaB [Pseudokineococcus basanitobsidens]|uniref:tRNA (adenosine(37)-N6)-threonylcarbamoyltransferase complex dimerization subunit type 1 TsaB n=1 Tax=Pseudokineococcus basanitobsidens TaxID=1926649 RepID=UPI003BB6B921